MYYSVAGVSTGLEKFMESCTAKRYSCCPVGTKLEEIMEFGGMKKNVVFLIISAGALLYSLIGWCGVHFDTAWIAVILCGIPIVIKGTLALFLRFDIKADVLVSMAIVASIVIGEIFAAGEVAFIMQLGSLLEDLTVSRARAGIEKLVYLTPATARRIVGGEEEIIQAGEVRVDDVLRVLAGETVPVDGIIIKGQSSINQAVMTGESLPVDKSVGDEVSSGTVNQFGVFEMRATKVGADSTIQKMIKLVQSADAGKAKIVGIADRWTTWIVMVALVSALLTCFFTGEIIRAVTILVVFCPCALVLATPAAIMAAIGNSTKHGFLVKEGDALERISNVDVIAFDKTGTLTYGMPKVENVIVLDTVAKQDLYKYAASLEQYSEHPLGKAIVKSYLSEDGSALYPVEDFSIIPGRGVTGKIDHKSILAGSLDFMAENGIPLAPHSCIAAEKYLETGATIIYVALEKKVAGFLVMTDAVRKESRDTIRRLKELKLTSVLLTGDNKRTAGTIGDLLEIENIHAECLPMDKLKYITGFQKNRQSICMIGDGINDALALKTANVGIAMGCIGSDIAMDAADIVIVDDEVKELPHLFSLAKRMMMTIKWNMTFSIILNFIAILLAMKGILNPVIGALVHNGGSVLVIINSAFLLTWKSEK